MVEVTRELFHREIAEAVFAHLRDFLLKRKKPLSARRVSSR